MALNTKQKQWQLYYLGYYGTSINDIDGIWGANSIKATKTFQKDSGLKVDGIFGTNSMNKSKAIIKVIQKKINALPVDGLAGILTINQTKRYQKSININTTGRADANTRNVMGINMKSITDSSVNNTTIIVDTTINTTIPIVSPPTSTTTGTGTWWDNIKYFDKEEFKCKCGGRYCNGYPKEPQRLLVEAADDVREYFDAPVRISSGLRCSIHNANEGGVSNSRHLSGKACDFCVDGKTANQVLKYVKTLPNIRYCYAINDRYVHMDIY